MFEKGSVFQNIEKVPYCYKTIKRAWV